MATISARTVETAKPKTKAYKLTADVGLLLWVYPTGLKRWVTRFVIDGKQRQATLAQPYGLAGEGYMTLAQACAENERIQALAKDGIDFRDRDQEKQLQKQNFQKQKEIEAKTFNELFDFWSTDGVTREDGNKEINRSFKKDILPFIGQKAIKDITESDLRSLLKRIINRGAKRMAVRAYSDLVQLFSWAEKRQPWRSLMLNENPANLVDIHQLVGPEYDIYNIRERTLSDKEIQELSFILSKTTQDYGNLPTGQKRSATKPLKQETQLAIWICLSTLCRIGELLQTEWQHIDFNKKEWFIPKENVKATRGKKQDHLIFLSDFAMQQFKTLFNLTGSSKWCFPSKDGSKYLDVKTVTKQIADRQAMFSTKSPDKNLCHCYDNTLVLSNGNNGKWTPHDLRRTGATGMQSLGIGLDIIDRCQNHIIKGSRVRRHYLQYDYSAEKKEAWKKWGERIEKILSQNS
jgi:integrase